MNRQKHEMMLNITNHLGNANQNYIDTHQDDTIKKHTRTHNI